MRRIMAAEPKRHGSHRLPSGPDGRTWGAGRRPMQTAPTGLVTRRPLLAGTAVALSAAVLRRPARAQREALAEQVVVIDTGQRVWRVPYQPVDKMPLPHG